jgi:hypothetical protein
MPESCRYRHVRGMQGMGVKSEFAGKKDASRHYLNAVWEGVNESEAGNSPPDIGGVAAPSIKRCEATAAAQTGWSGLTNCFGMRSLEVVPFRTTPSAPTKEASRHCLDVASTPPMSGGERPQE